MKTRKSWREKLADDKGLPRVILLEGKSAARFGCGTMVIPAPREVKELMDRVPKGRVATINELRGALALRHKTNLACPLTTGIFAWIAANAADEAEHGDGQRGTPYWRTLKADGELNPKYPGGIRAVRARLESEGHEIVQRGNRYFVKDFEARLHIF